MHNGSTNCCDFAAPKPGVSTPKRKNDDFEARFKRNFKRKIINAKIKKFAAKAPFTRLTLPLQCDLRLSAAKRNSITHAAAARSNLDAAIPLPSANIELQNASFRARLLQIPKVENVENEAFARGFFQIPVVEEMKTKLSCEASFKFQELKRWKRRFRARLPSTSKRSRSDRISSVQQFQCTEYLNTCKTQ